MISKEETNSQDNYDASKITVLEGLAPVRKRPGMYIGGTGEDGLHHLVWEVLDNAIDEAMGGFCNQVCVTIHADGSVSVLDNGRGIPVDKHKTTGKSALETVLTTLHSGGKFGEGGYKVSGGLHGVGVSVVNALSVWVKAEVRKGGKTYFQEYKRGDALADVKTVGDSSENGTTITFMPDPEIFTTTTEFSFQTIVNRARQQAYLTKGVVITVIDEREKQAVKTIQTKEQQEDEDAEEEEVKTGRAGGDEDEVVIERAGPQQYSFYFEGGISSYVRHINKNRIAINEPPLYAEKEINGVLVELSMAYTDDFKEHIYCFANNINTPEGGTHLTGFRTALTRALNDFVKKGNLTKDVLTGEDVREGLTAVLSVKLRDPQFEGQTKAKLGNTEVRTIVDSVAAEAITIYLDEHPNEARRIIEKCSLSAKARLAARAARETIIRKGALDGMTLPGKLADCSSKDPSKTEIYIVEGDSAGGCFDGETKIALTDGRDLSFKDLMEEWQKGKTNYCYTIKNDGQIGIEKILNPHITKKTAEVIKITLDNNETIICTPDHLFMLRDGAFKAAKDLKNTMSLMPLRKKISKMGGRITIAGYEMVFNPQDSRWIFTHLLADHYNLENKIYQNNLGVHKHHLDFNKLNNNPTNIRRMPYDRVYLNTGLDFTKKIYEKTGDIGLYDQKRLALPKRNPNLIRMQTLINRFFNGNKHNFIEAVQNFNHKIKKIEKVKEKIDVYDIEVPNTHNFALASGVFVHNSAKQGRDRNFQAILPLRGKILNVERARLDKMLSSDEIKALIVAMGVGIGDEINYSKLRYDRIIIMTDADVDGAHIRTLLLTFLFRNFPELISHGHVYIAQPPLFSVAKGKDKDWVYTEAERDAAVKKMMGNREDGSKPVIQRFKGLGEMSAEQLWETTMNPENRVLLQVTIDSAEKADETFTMLMGDQVPPRKKFITTRAKTVQNLDA